MNEGNRRATNNETAAATAVRFAWKLGDCKTINEITPHKHKRSERCSRKQDITFPAQNMAAKGPNAHRNNGQI